MRASKQWLARARRQQRGAELATFTGYDQDRIVFETIADERAPGLLLLIHGAVFAGAPLYASALYGLKGASAWLLLVVGVLAGLAETAFASIVLLKSEWLVIDLRRRSYTGHRGVLFWGDKWSGPIGDFHHIRLSEVPRGRHGRHRRLVVEWVWAEPGRPPFRVTGWGRLKSFRITRCPQGGDGRGFLRDLRAVAEDVGLPLVVPERYVDGLGVNDREVDGPANKAMQRTRCAGR